MANPVIAYIGLGANLGDREATIRQALERLGNTPGLRIRAVSELRETDPVGGPPQPKFLNGAARLESTLGPEALLQVMQALETDAGRDPGDPPNHPRSLDLDLLIYGDLRLQTEQLQLPHPRMWDRGFVLDPLRELGCDIPPRPKVALPVCILEPSEAAAQARTWRAGGSSIGFVPTMGALHEGHASLIRLARRECDRLLVSVFVNPLQFGPDEDLQTYPVSPEQDDAILAAEGVDLVFRPGAEALFPEGFASRIAVGREAEGMEGASRPGHFGGVATVVARLWLLINPDRSYFGCKDAQQLAVLRRLHQDLSLSGELVPCPIVRDHDGLALSSRNKNLDSQDRQAAGILYRALSRGRDSYRSGERRQGEILAAAHELLTGEPRCQVDYLELRAADSLQQLEDPIALPAQLLIAAVIGDSTGGGTRLIDNMLLEGSQA